MRLRSLFREPLVLWESQDYASILNPLKKLDPKADWSNEEEKIENARRVLKRSDRIMWWLRWWRLALVKEIVTYKTLPAIDGEVLQRLLDDYSRKAGKLVLAKNIPDKRFIQGRLDTFAHYLSLPIAAIQNRVFGFEHPSELHQEFAEAERQWQEQSGEDDPKRRFAYDPKLASKEEVLISFPDGSEWINTHLANCDREAGAMTHCGNRPRSHTKDKLLSLRRYVDPSDLKQVRRTEQGWMRDDGKPPAAVSVVPMLTFILDEDGNLGEMKGPKNNKPGARHYPHIVALLRQPFVKGVTEGHWASDNDFKLAWLPEATQDELWNEKPALFHGDDLVMMLSRRPDIPIDGELPKKLRTGPLFNLVKARPETDLTYDMLKRFRDEIAPSHMAEFVRSRPDLTVEQKLMLLKDGDAVFAFLMASPEITEVTHSDLVLRLSDLPATKKKTLFASRQFSRATFIAMAQYDGEFLNYVYGRALDKELAEIAAINSNDAKRIIKRIPKKLQSTSVLKAYWTKLAREGHVRKIQDIPSEYMTPEAAHMVLNIQLSYQEVKPEQVESLVPPAIWQSQEIQRLYWDKRNETEFHLRPSDLPSHQHVNDWSIKIMCIRHPSVIQELYDSGRLDSNLIWHILTIKERSQYSHNDRVTINYRTLAATPPDMVLYHPKRATFESILRTDIATLHARSPRGEPRHTVEAANQVMRIFGAEMEPATASVMISAGVADEHTLPDGVFESLPKDTQQLAASVAATWDGLARKWPTFNYFVAVHALTLLATTTGRMRLDKLPLEPLTTGRLLEDVFNKLYHMDVHDRGIYGDLKRANLLTDDVRGKLASMGLMPIREMSERELEIARSASSQMQGLARRLIHHPNEMADLPISLQRVCTRNSIFQKKLWRYTDPRAASSEMVDHALNLWEIVHKPKGFNDARYANEADNAPQTDELRKWLARVPMSNVSDATASRAAEAGFIMAPSAKEGEESFPFKIQRGY